MAAIERTETLLDRQGRLVTTLLDDERLEPQVLRVLDAPDAPHVASAFSASSTR